MVGQFNCVADNVNQDGVIDYKDILRWNPILDKALVANISKVEEQAREIIQNKNSFISIAPLNAPFIAQVNVNANAKKVVSNASVVVVAGPASIKVIDKASATIVASIATGFVSDMLVDNNLLWVALGSAGLRVFDISDANAPILLAASETPVERLSRNNGIWAAWVEQAGAIIGQLAINQGNIDFSNQINVGEASFIGQFRAIDGKRFALSTQSMTTFSEKLNIVSIDSKAFETALELDSMEAVSGLLVRDGLIYVSSFIVGGQKKFLRAYQVGDRNFLALVPLNARSGIAFSSLISTAGAIVGYAENTLHILNPYTLETVKTISLSTGIESIDFDGNFYWIAHGQAGLVKAQFTAPDIVPNTAVQVDFAGLRDFQYTVRAGDTTCFSSEAGLNEIEVDRTCFAEDGFVVVDVEGGQIFDADADGVPDLLPTAFSGKISAVITPADLFNGTARVSLLGDVIYRLFGSDLLLRNTTLVQYKQKTEILSKIWMKQDITGDTFVNQLDLLSWLPNENSYNAVVFSREVVGNYIAAIAGNQNIERSLHDLVGNVRNAIKPSYQFNVLGGNDQYLLGGVGYSRGEVSNTSLYLMSSTATSEYPALAEFKVDGYVSSFQLHGSLALAGLTNGDGIVFDLNGNRFSELRKLTGCGVAAWYGNDLVCASGAQTVFRVDPVSGEVKWTRKIENTYMFSSVLASDNLLAVESGDISFIGHLTLLAPSNGVVSGTRVRSNAMSFIQPIAVANDTVYAYVGDLSGTSRLDRTSLNGNNLIATKNIFSGRIQSATASADTLSLLSGKGFLTVKADDLSILSSHMSGVTNFNGAVKAGNNWIVLTNDGNILTYEINSD